MGIPHHLTCLLRLKHLPAMGEIWIRSLGQENPLEKEMATHSSTLAWKIPWMEESCRLQSMGVAKNQTGLSMHTGCTCCKFLDNTENNVKIYNPTVIQKRNTQDFLRNLYAGQEATVRTGLGTTDWFQIRKGVRQGCILSPCLFNLYAEYIMRNARLEEAQAGIKIAGRNIDYLRYADDTTLMAES